MAAKKKTTKAPVEKRDPTPSERIPMPFAMPLSEDVTKRRTATKAECIETLRAMALESPTQVISRNYFRVHSPFSEAAWNCHFGTFHEFKRQAGIVLSRAQHLLEKNIAKHASVDVLRAMNAEKSGWEGKYLRPDSKRFQTVMVATDVHDVECDPFWRRCFIDTVGRIQPEKVVLGGDLLDLCEFGRYAVDPREWDVVGRIRWAHQFLQDIREAAPSTECWLIEGNHEARLLKHLAEATPALKVVLSDLHGFTVPKLLGLDQFEVNYVARTDLATFNQRDMKAELSKNYQVFHDCFLVHHFPEGERLGLAGCNGHHHRHWSHQHFTPSGGAWEWHQLGCGHRRSASYCAGEQWGTGFLTAHIDIQRKHVIHDYAQIRDFAVIAGRYYERGPEEV